LFQQRLTRAANISASSPAPRTVVFFGSVTSIVSTLVISAVPVPPSFTSQPVSQTYYVVRIAIFSTTVSSPGNISYQWFSNNIAIAGETGSTLTLK